MALQKQVVPVQFTGGMDTKTAEQLVVPGKFLLLRNCVRRQGDKVDKRFGFAALSKETLNSYQGVSDEGPVTLNAVANGTALARFKNELLLLDSTNFQLFSYSRSSGKWVSRQADSDQGLMSLLTVGHIDSTNLIRNSGIQTMPDMATIGNVSAVVWEDSSGGCRYSIFDNTTNEIIVSSNELTSTGSRPKIIGMNNTFVMCYYDGGSLKLRRITTTAITTITAEVTITPMNNEPWDIENYSTYSVFALNNGSDIVVGYLNYNGVLGNNFNGMVAPHTFSNPADKALTIQVDQVNGRIFVLYDDSGDNILRYIVTDEAFLTFYDSSIGNIPNIRNLTLFSPKSTSPTTQLEFLYEVNFTMPSGAERNSIALGEIEWDGSAAPSFALASSDHTKFGTGLVVKGITAGKHSFTVGAFESEIQPTYFIYGPGFTGSGDSSSICARFTDGIAGGYTKDEAGNPRSGLTKANVLADGSIIFPSQIKNALRAINGVITSDNIGLQIVKFTFPVPYYSVDTLGDNAHIAGSVLLHYDGVQAFEDNFHVFPEKIMPTVASGTGTFPGAATYNYAVTYEWTDAKGQINRSAPSVMVPAAVTATTDEVTINIPTMRTYTNSLRDIKIVIYRSGPNLSTVLYKLVSLDNDLSVVGIDYVDDNSDAANLTSREILYTVGGVLENIAAPSCKVVHKLGNRLFLTGLEDPTLVQYSREWVPQEPVQFNDTLTIRTDELGGKITTLGSLDDKLIIFKRDRLFSVSGTGPTDSGEQNTFTAPQLISADVGSEEPLSVVITPMGLMFKSLKGIYLLDRGLETRYIGAAVEDYNHLQISSAQVLTALNEVRFTTSDGDCMVYNYYFDQWSVFSNYSAVSAILDVDDSYLHLKPDGTVNREMQDLYNDNHVRYSMDIETSWFSFNNVQGFQRIYRISVLGDFLSNHYTQMDIAYDFKDVYNQTIYFNTATGLSSSTYGDDALYGDSTPYGGLPNREYQFRVKPRIQKCESIKVRLRDIDTQELEGGGSFSLVHMAFEIGAKTGVDRQGVAKSK